MRLRLYQFRCPERQGLFDRGRACSPRLEPDAPGLAGALGGDCHLAGHPPGIRPGAADQPQAAAVGYGRRQGTPGRAAHGCQRDGVLQGEEFGERGSQRHEPIITRPSARG